MKYFAYILLLISVNSCIQPPPPRDIEGSKKQKAANQVFRKAALRIKNELGLQPVGRMGQMLHKVQKLGLSFYCYQPLDIVEGRKLIVKTVQIMMEEMDGSEELRPYLGQYPVTAWNTEMTLFPHTPERREPPAGEIVTIGASDRVLYYNIRDKTHQLKTIYEETFEEALERIADPNLPLVAYQEPKKEQTESPQVSCISFVDAQGRIWIVDEKGEMQLKHPQKNTEQNRQTDRF